LKEKSLIFFARKKTFSSRYWMTLLFISDYDFLWSIQFHFVSSRKRRLQLKKIKEQDQVSISSSYVRIFHTYVVFLLRFGFVKKFVRTGFNFIYILCTNFWYEHRFASVLYVHKTREKLPKQRSYKKFVPKMLMILTTSIEPVSWQQQSSFSFSFDLLSLVRADYMK